MQKADWDKLDKLTDWLKAVPWKFFCTFTFAWRVSDQQAEHVFAAFSNRLERHLRCEVCLIRGDEKRFSGCAKPASGRVFHVLLACIAPVNASFIQSLWKTMAGNRSDDAGALVEQYNSGEDGARYVLKCIIQRTGTGRSGTSNSSTQRQRTAKANARWRRKTAPI